MTPGRLYFSTEGRIGRASWWAGIIGIVVIAVVATLILWWVFDAGLFLSMPGRIAGFILNLVLLAMSYALAVKRFNDRDRPNIYPRVVAILFLIKLVLDLFRLTGDPWMQNSLDTVFQGITFIIGIWYFIELGCLRGTIGPNPHGDDPVVLAAQRPQRS